MATEKNLLKNESIDNKFVSKKFVPRTPMDQQRIRVEKLMEHPEKPVMIPTPSNHNKDKKFLTAIPTFVRNVMGSSAGAGSGEFHVYRHLRRKEYARQKHIQQKSKQELLDDEFQQRIEKNRSDADAKTAKKRAKRLKKKAKQKIAKLNSGGKKSTETTVDGDDDSQSESSGSEVEDDAEKDCEKDVVDKSSKTVGNGKELAVEMDKDNVAMENLSHAGESVDKVEDNSENGCERDVVNESSRGSKELADEMDKDGGTKANYAVVDEESKPAETETDENQELTNTDDTEDLPKNDTDKCNEEANK